MQHPDEGTIHAWLDGALSADEARAIEAHVAGCAECTAAVAEARGLLAASSRILSALDAVPGGVLPVADPLAAAGERVVPIGRRSPWRSPGWRAAAAIVLVGSVSWLVTRSTRRADVATTASEVSAAPEVMTMMDTMAVATPPRARAAAPAVAAEPTPSGRAPRIAAQSTPRAPSAAARAATAPMVAAAPSRAMGIRTGALSGAAVPNAQAPAPKTFDATAAGAAALPNAPSAGARPGAGMAADANVRAQAVPSAARELAEKRASTPTSLLERSEMPMAKANVALAGTSGNEAAARLLAGCYALERMPERAGTAGSDSAALLLPARVELLLAPDTASGPGARLFRPAPGDPPFAAGTLASWKVVAPRQVQLRIGDAARWFTAVVSIASDSAGPFAPTMRGRRIACPAP